MKFACVTLFWLALGAGYFAYRQLADANSERYWRAWWEGFYQSWKWDHIFKDDPVSSYDPTDYSGYNAGCGCRQVTQFALLLVAGLIALCVFFGSFIWSIL